MQPDLLAAAEAVLFASGDSVSLEELGRALDLTALELPALEQALYEKYARPESGLRLLRLEDRLQLCTKPGYRETVEKALAPARRQTLTQAALETLSVVAYRQPVTRMEIELIRGVQCDHAVATLVNHGLIREVGRKDTIGRPILYGTTEEFLRHFGLSGLEELPPVEDFSSLETERDPLPDGDAPEETNETNETDDPQGS